MRDSGDLDEVEAAIALGSACRPERGGADSRRLHGSRNERGGLLRLVRYLAPLALVAAEARAQQPGEGASARLTGVVVDSLRGGALRGAIVRVEGTTRLGFTDSLGRFALDSIPPGLREVELFHDVLDTLGVRVHTPQLPFTSDSTVELALGVPSPRTIIRAKCPASSADAGAVFGMVFDADSDEPVPGAQVRVSWVELSVSRESGVQYEPQRRETATDTDGRFKVCYLPSDLAADISAARGRDSTSGVSVNYDDANAAMTTLFLPVSRPDQTPGSVSVRGAVVTGTVVDSGGRPIPLALVAVASSAEVVETDSAGAFTLGSLMPGTQAMVVRRLGYSPVERIVHLTRRAPRRVAIRMHQYVPVLEAVMVEARRGAALDRVGFTKRKRETPGHFLTQADLERRNAMRVADFLEQIPGLRRANAFGEYCIRYWVDGMRWQGEPDEFMMPNEVAAIETYTSSFVPADFQSFDQCSAVVIWTKWKLGTR